MAHNRIIIISSIQAKLDALNGLQPETGQWESLLEAVNSADEALETNISSAQKKRLHTKLHELEEFLEAGQPFDMNQVQAFTDEISSLL